MTIKDSEKDSVTICIGTVGSSTFERCKSFVDIMTEGDVRVKDVVVIKNKRPQAAWLNAMRDACVDTKWCLQVDEDMYLKKDALSRLIDFAEEAEKKGISVLNASSLLYDIFLRTKIGSLKLWSSKALQQQAFRDTLGGDRDYAKRAFKKGFSNIELPVVLGDHDSAPTELVAYNKYFEYVQKIRKFKNLGSAKNFVNFLKKKHASEGTKITAAAYNGAKSGLCNSIFDKSKDHFDISINSYIFEILRPNNPAEIYKKAKEVSENIIAQEDVFAHAAMVKTLKQRWENSGEYSDKKAYDGAKIYLRKTLVS